MAKKKRAEQEEPRDDVLDPKRAHELLGLPGPYESPEPPIPTTGYVTFWDPGVSVHRLREQHRVLFYPAGWLDTAKFARETDSWRWRQLRVEPIAPGESFPDQEEAIKKLGTGDEVCPARVLVTFLILEFLATGRRREVRRCRCRDVLPSGRRVIVGPFHEHGLDIGSVGDRWQSPSIGLCGVFTPKRK